MTRYDSRPAPAVPARPLWTTSSPWNRQRRRRRRRQTRPIRKSNRPPLLRNNCRLQQQRSPLPLPPRYSGHLSRGEYPDITPTPTDYRAIVLQHNQRGLYHIALVKNDCFCSNLRLSSYHLITIQRGALEVAAPASTAPAAADPSIVLVVLSLFRRPPAASSLFRLLP